MNCIAPTTSKKINQIKGKITVSTYFQKNHRAMPSVSTKVALLTYRNNKTIQKKQKRWTWSGWATSENITSTMPTNIRYLAGCLASSMMGITLVRFFAMLTKSLPLLWENSTAYTIPVCKPKQQLRAPSFYKILLHILYN